MKKIKASNYSGLGHIPLHHTPFLAKSHIQDLHGCSSSTSDTSAHRKPRLSVTNPTNLGFGEPGPAWGQRRERGLFLSSHKRIPGSERFHMSLSCFCFHSLNQTLPHGFRSDCKNQHHLYNGFFHLLLFFDGRTLMPRTAGLFQYPFPSNALFFLQQP